MRDRTPGRYSLLPEAEAPEPDIRRVLIYRLGSLGDTVVALPCLHLIARRFPNAERVLLTGYPVTAKAPAAAAVLGVSELVHRYMSYTVGTRNVSELLQVAWKIRRFAPEVVVYLMPIRPYKSVLRDRIFLRLVGVERIVGLPEQRMQKRRLDAATGLYEAEAVRLAQTIRELGVAGVDKLDNWDLRLSQGERQAATAALGKLASRPLIVCGPGTKMQAKDWGKQNWRELLGRLHARYPQHGLALIGASEDSEASEFAAERWGGAKVNLCGQLTPRETAAALAGAQAFLGPDSGPMHLAASVGVHCAIAFSAHGLPGVWFPVGEMHQIVYHRTECHGCGLEICIDREQQCMREITVDEMEQAAIRVLENSAQNALVEVQ